MHSIIYVIVRKYMSSVSLLCLLDIQRSNRDRHLTQSTIVRMGERVQDSRCISLYFSSMDKTGERKNRRVR